MAVKQTGKIGSGKAGPGRPKGVPNKLTKGAKEAFQFAFDKIGGAEKLATWANDNATEFYKLFARLIPVEQQLTGKDGAELHYTLFVPSKVQHADD